MKLREKELIEWAWLNLQFNNCPKDWTETFIEDIINGYKGQCYTNEGLSISYDKIRSMFEIEEF